MMGIAYSHYNAPPVNKLIINMNIFSIINSIYLWVNLIHRYLKVALCFHVIENPVGCRLVT